jgi:hypothetical protein
MIIQVDMNDDISAATEIEFYIDTPDQIKKTRDNWRDRSQV